jgi:hypothetical protein
MKDSISDVKVGGYDTFTGAGNSTAVDRQGFEGVLFAGTIGTASTANLRLEDSDDNSTFADVAADLQYGDTGVVATGTFKVGYTGYKQYVRLVDDAGTSVVNVVTVLRHPCHEAQA